MPRFQLGDSEMQALIAYLRSVPGVSREPTASICPPVKTGDDPGADASPPPMDDASAADASPPPADAGGKDAGGKDSGVADAGGKDAGSCSGYASPTTKAACHACKSGVTCQPNGCYGGYYCTLATTKCVPKPSGC
jgi:hypothetical protein